MSSLKSVRNGVPRVYDVCVVGGGPAGTITAIQLAKSGLSVLIVDRPTREVHKFGETLASAAIRLLNKIELGNIIEQLQKVTDQVCVEKVGGNLNYWGDSHIQMTDAIHDPYGLGLRIERTQFDALLKQKAHALGVHFYSSQVIAIEYFDLTKNFSEQYTPLAHQQNQFIFQSEKSELHRHHTDCFNWKIRLSDETYHHAKWLVDATGRSSKITRLLGVKRHQGEPLVALYRRVKPETNLNLNRTVIASFQDGWIYAGKINQQEWIFGFHTIPSIASRYYHQKSLWNDLIIQHNELNRLFGTVHFNSDIHTHDVCSHYLAQSMGEKWIACGDALLAFDPLAGQGLFNAIYTAVKAASTISSYFTVKHEFPQQPSDSNNKSSSQLYMSEMNSVVKTYLKRRHSLYLQEKRWSDSSFWQIHHRNKIILK